MKWVCMVCNYVHEGDAPPDACPVCGAGASAFEEMAAPEPDGGEDEVNPKTDQLPRQWVCTVCGYVHEGDGPPDTCPVCGQPWSVFVPKVDGGDLEKSGAGAGATSAVAASDETGSGEAQKANRWRCVVCNYIHEGDDAPDICPICGAKKDSFIPEKKSPKHHHRGFSGLIEKLHLHPVAAHFPNGALPLAFLSWVMYLVLGEGCLERASFYLMLVAAAAAPVTGITGWSDARHRFGTTETGVFPEKKRLSVVLGVLMTAMAVWRLVLGWTHVPVGTEMVLYTALLLAATGVTARLGMLGGKLVFGH
ncbi:MAG: hypothetical protein JXR76_29020 [Deltaproteobacteria bacterium]|nr:hypothetical protein [Deltaproteobacteria bacterium]